PLATPAGVAPAGAVARRPPATPGPARATLPPAGWLGLALLALGVPAGGGAAVLARRRRAAERAPVGGWAPR
ncbi:MAG TPA: hypothetical protein VLB47_01050, partial [Solirubrobacteraceae bacterium]|nr:hypothetical protein [Solirubrobacteraceae bacterium]